MREQIIELCQQVTARENKRGAAGVSAARGVGRTRLGHLLPRCLSAPLSLKGEGAVAETTDSRRYRLRAITRRCTSLVPS